MSDADIIVEVQGHAGIISLNRPKALNALTFDMVRAMSRQLVAWKDDDNIACVIVKSAGGRAFCAGGDVAEVIRTINDTGVDAAYAFFHDEYRLNWRIKNYPKPYIALIDGICMGGGFGISAHGHYRVVSEKTMMAMPETAIGLFPDVGGTFVLPRMPGELGQYLALTGARLNGEQTAQCGIGTHYSGTSDQSLIEQALAELVPGDDCHDRAGALLNDMTETVHDGPILDDRAEIDRIYAADTIDGIAKAIDESESEFSAKQRALFDRMSPLSLAVTARQIAYGKTHDFDDCMRLEYQMVHHFLTDSDFAEGVRAMLIDKDKAPRWRTLTGDPSEIDRFFEPVGAPLAFDWQGL